MLILSIIITVLLVAGLFLYLRKEEVVESDSNKATDVLMDNLKDPLVTSRAYFTEPTTGPIGDFVGYSPVSQDDWLHSFTHEESQDERSENDKIGSLI